MKAEHFIALAAFDMNVFGSGKIRVQIHFEPSLTD